MNTPAATVDDYIDSQPQQVQTMLREIRHRFQSVAPDAVEAIRYGMPAYRLSNGHPVYFAAWKKHISLHDIPTFTDELETNVAPYRNGKDTLRFELRHPIPYDLIEQIITTIAATTPAK
jgi:uncharacterized protein YdhG (YjbR/CyaY superfamily)